MAALVTGTEVRQIINTTLDDVALQPFIDLADLIITEEVTSPDISDARRKEIERYLTAHLVTCKVFDGRLTSLSFDDVKTTYAGKYGAGLSSSIYGQTALMLDTSEALAALQQRAALEYAAEFTVL